jgi:hypothetical protein
MVNENNPVKNIEYVVLSALNRMGLDMQEYDRFEQIGIEWYTELARTSTTYPSVEVTRFVVDNGSRIFSMPSDMITVSKVGIKRGERFWTLTRVDNLYTLDDTKVCAPVKDEQQSPDNVTGTWFMGHSWGGQYFPPRFTAGGGYNYAYYQVDSAQRQIRFSMNAEHLPNGEVWIEYISAGRNVTGKTVVNPAFIEPFRKYMIWQVAAFHDNPKFYNNQQDLERQYHDAMYNAAGSIAPTTDEILDALWAVSGFTLR